MNAAQPRGAAETRQVFKRRACGTAVGAADEDDC
jgi:hypothetical protein